MRNRLISETDFPFAVIQELLKSVQQADLSIQIRPISGFADDLRSNWNILGGGAAMRILRAINLG